MRFLPQKTITYRDAGLPEISSLKKAYMVQNYTGPGDTKEGANWIHWDHPMNWDLAEGMSWYYAVIDFKASHCSPVYGNSTTVQPSAMTVNFFVRAK